MEYIQVAQSYCFNCYNNMQDLRNFFSFSVVYTALMSKEIRKRIGKFTHSTLLNLKNASYTASKSVLLKASYFSWNKATCIYVGRAAIYRKHSANNSLD